MIQEPGIRPAFWLGIVLLLPVDIILWFATDEFVAYRPLALPVLWALAVGVLWVRQRARLRSAVWTEAGDVPVEGAIEGRVEQADELVVSPYFQRQCVAWTVRRDIVQLPPGLLAQCHVPFVLDVRGKRFRIELQGDGFDPLRALEEVDSHAPLPELELAFGRLVTAMARSWPDDYLLGLMTSNPQRCAFDEQPIDPGSTVTLAGRFTKVAPEGGDARRDDGPVTVRVEPRTGERFPILAAGPLGTHRRLLAPIFRYHRWAALLLAICSDIVLNLFVPS